MPVRVVDDLEVVDIHEECGDRGARPLGMRERVVDAVTEERAIREPGERVVEGVVFELVEEGLALRDVARREDDAADVLVVQQVGGQCLGVEPGSVGAAKRDLFGSTRPLAADEFERPHRLVGVDQLGEARPLERGRLEPEQALGGRADEEDRRVRVDQRDEIGRVVDERREAAVVELLLAQQPGGAQDDEHDEEGARERKTANDIGRRQEVGDEQRRHRRKRPEKCPHRGCRRSMIPLSTRRSRGVTGRAPSIE